MRFRTIFSSLIILAALVGCVSVEKTQSDQEKASYHYILGVTALNERQPTEALKEFLQAEKFDARDPEIQAGLAQAYWLKSAYELSEKHYKNAIELSDDDPQYHNNLAALYLSTERYDDAIREFQVAADNLLFDRAELAWTGIGQANTHKQDYQAAQDAFKKAMQVNPRYYMAPFRLGELYYNQDRPAEALDMFTRSLELAPGFVDAHYWQGLVYMKMKETEKAKAAFLRVLQMEPQGETARLAANYLKIIGK